MDIDRVDLIDLESITETYINDLVISNVRSTSLNYYCISVSQIAIISPLSSPTYEIKDIEFTDSEIGLIKVTSLEDKVGLNQPVEVIV